MISTQYQPLGPDSIGTVSARWIRPLDPDPEWIDIGDIAHSLSMQCRFTGHTKYFYSVAQHSVLVSTVAALEGAERRRELALWGLLHDASEAYLSDIARPLKNASSLEPNFGETYREVERGLLKAVAEKFNLPWPIPPAVYEADDLVLYAEMRDLLPYDPPAEVVRYGPRIYPVNPIRAKEMFLQRFEGLMA